MGQPLEVDVATAARMFAAGASLVDVREPSEWAVVALPGAKLIRMREIPARLADLPTDQPLLLLCHHGSRSRAVTDYLRGQGRDNAINVAGGIDAWAREVDPTLPRY